MEQAISRAGRRTGWSEYENNLLWETADEAQQQGLPLKAVFDALRKRPGGGPTVSAITITRRYKSAKALPSAPPGSCPLHSRR